MLVDWFTVAAQVLNFAVLLWLMKRFLYRPVLAAIDARERRIAAELADADAKRAEAERERGEYERRSAELEGRRAGLLKQAEEEAGAARQRLLAEARTAADGLRAKRMEALATEARDLERAISQRVRQEVFAIARRTLADLASTSLEERLVDAFVRRLRALEGAEREALAGALGTATGPALVRSAFELPEGLRAGISRALAEAFPPGVPVRFETAPEVIGGIELVANGEKVAWSIGDYLGSLESGVCELLDRQARSGPAAADGAAGADPAAGAP